MGRAGAFAASCATFALMTTILAAWPESARAATTLDVRARTRIELDEVHRTAGGVLVRGRVVDANSQEPIAAKVEVKVGELAFGGRSDDTGSFAIAVPGDRIGDRVDVAVTARGRFLVASQTALSGFEVSKDPLSLDLVVASVAEGAVTLTVTATSNGAPVPDARGTVDAGDVSVPFTTRADGTAEVRLPRRGTLAEPGRKSISATVPGSDLYDPATAEADPLIVARTRMTAHLVDDPLAVDDDVQIEGRLVADGARPVRGARVALRPVDEPAGAQGLGSALTDDEGRFVLRARAADVGIGQHRLQVVFDAPEPWLESTQSPALAVHIEAAQPVPVGYSLAAFGVTALALVAFAGLRTRPWQRWRRSSDEGRPEGRTPEARPVTGGLREGRPGLMSTIRRPHERGFSALVRDAVTRAPIAGARVDLRRQRASDAGDDRIEVASDDRGLLAVAHLDDGTWTGQVQAPHYVPEAFHLTIPHRGELSGAMLDLVPVRERIFDLYKEAALPLLPRPALWGIWTPRQIIAHVRSAAASPAPLTPALTALTDFVEESYFSPRRPMVAALETCSELVAAAVAEHRRRPGAPPC